MTRPGLSPGFFTMTTPFSDLELITSSANPLFKKVQALSSGRSWRKSSELLLIGEKEVQLARELGLHFSHLFFSNDEIGSAAYLKQSEVKEPTEFSRLSPPLMAKLLPGHAGYGILAMAELRLLDLPEEFSDCSHLIVLDGLQDPGNVGTILRTAAAFNFQEVIFLDGSVRLNNPKLWRAACGSLPALRIYQSSRHALIQTLKISKLKVLIADLAGLPLDDWQRDCRSGGAAGLCLILGNEGHGPSAELKSAFPNRVTIPISEGAESLNVAMAAGILMYGLRQEKRSDESSCQLCDDVL